LTDRDIATGTPTGEPAGVLRRPAIEKRIDEIVSIA